MVSGVFLSVLDVFFKYFICFRSYVAIVAHRCFKTRSSVASPSSFFYCLILVSGADTGAGERSRRDMCGQAQDGGSGAGIRTTASVRTLATP